jgi:WD40 repeat protein
MQLAQDDETAAPFHHPGGLAWVRGEWGEDGEGQGIGDLKRRLGELRRAIRGGVEVESCAEAERGCAGTGQPAGGGMRVTADSCPAGGDGREEVQVTGARSSRAGFPAAPCLSGADVGAEGLVVGTGCEVGRLSPMSGGSISSRTSVPSLPSTNDSCAPTFVSRSQPGDYQAEGSETCGLGGSKANRGSTDLSIHIRPGDAGRVDASAHADQRVRPIPLHTESWLEILSHDPSYTERSSALQCSHGQTPERGAASGQGASAPTATPHFSEQPPPAQLSRAPVLGPDTPSVLTAPASDVGTMDAMHGRARGRGAYEAPLVDGGVVQRQSPHQRGLKVGVGGGRELQPLQPLQPLLLRGADPEETCLSAMGMGGAARSVPGGHEVGGTMGEKRKGERGGDGGGMGMRDAEGLWGSPVAAMAREWCERVKVVSPGLALAGLPCAAAAPGAVGKGAEERGRGSEPGGENVGAGARSPFERVAGGVGGSGDAGGVEAVISGGCEVCKGSEVETRMRCEGERQARSDASGDEDAAVMEEATPRNKGGDRGVRVGEDRGIGIGMRAKDGWQAHSDAVWALACGGNCVFSGAHDGVVKQWRRRVRGVGERGGEGGKWECVRSVSLHTEAVLSLAWMLPGVGEGGRGGGLLVSGSADCLAKVTCWGERGGAECVEEVATLALHTQRVGALVVLDEHVASGSADDSIRIWDTQRWECIQTLRGHTDSVVVLSRFRQWLCSGSCDGSVCLWSLTTWQCERRLEGHMGSVLALIALPDTPATQCSHPAKTPATTRQGLAADCSGEAEGGDQVSQGASGSAYKECAGCHHDDENGSEGRHARFLVSASDDQSLRVWDAGGDDWECSTVAGAHEGPVTLLSVCGGGKGGQVGPGQKNIGQVGPGHGQYLLSCGDDQTLRVWSLCARSAGGVDGVREVQTMQRDADRACEGGRVMLACVATYVLQTPCSAIAHWHTSGSSRAPSGCWSAGATNGGSGLGSEDGGPGVQGGGGAVVTANLQGEVLVWGVAG